MTKIFLSFASDSAEDLYKTLTDLLSGQRVKLKYKDVEGEINPPVDPEMAEDAATLSDAEYDAKYDPNAPRSEFPPEEQPPKAAGGKPNGGGGPSTPPSSAPAASKRPGRPPKAVSAPAPAPELAPIPSFIVLRDAIVDAFKKAASVEQDPKGLRAAAETMRKKAGYDRIMAMPDTPELQTVLWEFCQAQGIEVV